MKAESTTVSSVCLDDALQRRVEEEYLEMPGLKLTPQQASRLWQLDPAASAKVLAAMAEAGVLHRARDGGYVLLFAR